MLITAAGDFQRGFYHWAKVIELKSISRAMIYIDMEWHSSGMPRYTNSAKHGVLPPCYETHHGIDPRHGGENANAVFVGGQAETVPFNDIPYYWYIPDTNPIIWEPFWGRNWQQGKVRGW